MCNQNLYRVIQSLQKIDMLHIYKLYLIFTRFNNWKLLSNLTVFDVQTYESNEYFNFLINGIRKNSYFKINNFSVFVLRNKGSKFSMSS